MARCDVAKLGFRRARFCKLKPPCEAVAGRRAMLPAIPIKQGAGPTTTNPAPQNRKILISSILSIAPEVNVQSSSNPVLKERTA